MLVSRRCRLLQRGGLKQRKPILPWSGGQRSDIKVSAGLVPSEARKENLSQAPQCSLPPITPGSTPSSQGLLPSASVFCVLSSSYTDASQTGLEAHPSPVWPHLNERHL